MGEGIVKREDAKDLVVQYVLRPYGFSFQYFGEGDTITFNSDSSLSTARRPHDFHIFVHHVSDGRNKLF